MESDNYKRCYFCNCILQPGKYTAQSKEHIFKKEWLKRFDYLKLKMSFEEFRKTDKLYYRTMVANNVLASAVCNSCNNGWMNTTDINVQNVLFEILNDSSKIKDLNEKEEFYLSRYIFKTALAASSMVANAEIPLHVRQMAMNHEYIPEGFLCLALLFDPPAEYIGFSIVKEWAKTPFTESSSETARIMDLTSFKFAIRFNSFIIGCAYIDTLMPCFYFDPDYYSFIYSKGSRYQFEKSKYHSVGNPDLYMTPENYFNLHIYASVYRDSLV